MALKTTSGSSREKWVAAFLPAVAIILVAFMYISFYANPEYETVEKQYKAAVENFIPQQFLKQREDERQQLIAEQNDRQSTMASVEEELTEKSIAFKQLSPTAKHTAVIALLQEYNVAILEDQISQKINLPTLRSESAKVLQSLLPKDAINFRDLTLTADYPTVVELLKNLPEIPGVLPVNVLLKKTKGVASSDEPTDSTAVWTFTVLM